MIVVHVLILWGLVVVALTVAFLVERRRKQLEQSQDGEQQDDEKNGSEKKKRDKPEYQVALGFVASSYGLLLGLLVAFGANHYSDVRARAQDEADSMIALWDTVAVYPPSRPGSDAAPDPLLHACDPGLRLAVDGARKPARDGRRGRVRRSRT